MTTHLVTRHPGALEWLLARGLTEIEHVPHLDPARVEPGDVVVGTLPVHLAAAVCELGARARADGGGTHLLRRAAGGLRDPET
jgi:CRISPR-associated protein Csx16